LFGAAVVIVSMAGYFGALQLPEKPTIYDHLIMGLRETDLIATFNWDPLLLQAFQRAPRWLSKPRLAFLHGSVAIGYCDTDERTGVVCGSACKRNPVSGVIGVQKGTTIPMV
jgi:hypothetical protein